MEDIVSNTKTETLGESEFPTREELIKWASPSQVARFATQLDLEEVYYRCKQMGLKVIGVKGQRIYGRLLSGLVPNPDGSRSLQKEGHGTASVLQPRTIRDRQVGWDWVGEEEIEGGYEVTVSLPRS